MTLATPLVAAAALVWAGGQLAARLFAGTWLELSVADAVGVLWRLPATLHDPARAWPPHAAALLPGPVAMWSMLAAVTTLAALAVGVMGTALLRRRGSHGDPQAAVWARPRDLRPLTVDRPTPGRLTLGRAGRRLLAAEPAQAVIVLGPARSGKTTGLAIPAILEWDGPVIATSVRTDLVDATLARRQPRGRVWVYDPTRTAPLLPHAGWNPLDGCLSWQGAQQTATWLCEAGRQDGRLDDADFWYATAAKLLAPLLFAAATSGRSMADVLCWIDTQEHAQVRLELEAAGHLAALHAAQASFGREERTRSSVYTTAEMTLRAFADPAVLESTEHSDISAARLLDGDAHTLYVCAPSHEQARLQPVFSALLHQIITAAYDHTAARGQPLERRLLIVLDEAANIAPLRDLDTLASTAAGTGIQLLTVWQDMAQIIARYGDRAATVVNNHRGKLVLSGISDEPTLRYVSTLIGDTEISRRSTTTDADGRRSATDAAQWRQLASADTLRRIPPDHALLLYGHLPPAQLALRPWYSERAWKPT